MSNDYIKLVRRLKLWVVLLSVLNITIVSTIGVNMYIAKKKEALSEQRASGVSSFFVTYLQLTDNQKSQFDSISNGYHSNLKTVGIMLRSVKERMNKHGVEKDSIALNKIFEDFLVAQSLNRDFAVEYYDCIRSICTPKQIQRFNEVITRTTISTESQLQIKPNRIDEN